MKSLSTELWNADGLLLVFPPLRQVWCVREELPGSSAATGHRAVVPLPGVATVQLAWS